MGELLSPPKEHDWISVNDLVQRIQIKQHNKQIIKWKHVTELVVQLYLE